MTRLSSWFVEHLSQLLEPEEREAVHGDLEECRITGARALLELSGLVVRRHAEVWAGGRAWLALGATLSVGMILSVVSRQWATVGAIYGWTYVDHWTWGYLESPGARLDLARALWGLMSCSVALIVWSWTSGLAIGSLSRRSAFTSGVVFSVVVFAGTAGTTTTGLQNPFNSNVFSATFYRIALPVIVRTVLVVLPALWGMQRLRVFSWQRALACAVIVIAMTAYMAHSLEASVVFGWVPLSVRWPAAGGLWAWRSSRLLTGLPLIMVSPGVLLWIPSGLPV